MDINSDIYSKRLTVIQNRSQMALKQRVNMNVAHFFLQLNLLVEHRGRNSGNDFSFPVPSPFLTLKDNWL